MRLLVTITAYPPSIGGAQIHAHYIARQLCGQHQIQAISQWDRNRTDWLLGTTLNSPTEARGYVVDGVPVQRIALPGPARRGMTPWVLGYYFVEGPAIQRIAAALADQIRTWAETADLV